MFKTPLWLLTSTGSYDIRLGLGQWGGIQLAQSKYQCLSHTSFHRKMLFHTTDGMPKLNCFLLCFTDFLFITQPSSVCMPCEYTPSCLCLFVYLMDKAAMQPSVGSLTVYLYTNDSKRLHRNISGFSRFNFP